MTECELERTKKELVRALRRRAAEIDGESVPTAGRTMLMPASSVMTPMRPRKERVAFFARETFRNAALTPVATRRVD